MPNIDFALQDAPSTPSGELEKALERVVEVLKKNPPSPESIPRVPEEDVADFLDTLTKALQEIPPSVIDAIKSSRTN